MFRSGFSVGGGGISIRGMGFFRETEIKCGRDEISVKRVIFPR